MAMPPSLAAPELRRATRRMGAMPTPTGSAPGRGLLRRLTALVPPAGAEDAGIEAIGHPSPVRLHRPQNR